MPSLPATPTKSNASQAGRLLRLYEDLFLYICNLNRQAGSAAAPHVETVESAVEKLRAEIRKRAEAERLVDHVAALEHPIDVFIDSMIIKAGVSCSHDWKNRRLAKKHHGDQGGDATFFKLLEATLRQNTEQASEILTVYYTCLGLGYTGAYASSGDRDEDIKDFATLQDFMRRILEASRHLRELMPDQSEPRLTPAAYFVSPAIPQSPWWTVWVATAGFLLFVGFFYGVLVYQFKASSEELRDSLSTIEKHYQRTLGQVEPNRTRAR